MPSIRIRRTVAIVVLAAASSILHLPALQAFPRGESHGGRPERVHPVVRVPQPGSLWRFLVGLWENAGLRIDDNG
jgi:hypothetical protein